MIVWLATPVAAQTVWTVGPGGPHTSIGAVLPLAADGDVIEVEPGVYAESLDLLDRVLTLRGTGGSAVTTLAAGVRTELVLVAGGTVSLSGFTLAPVATRAVVVEPSRTTGLPADVTLEDVVFVGATVDPGDARYPMGTSLHADGSTVTVSRSAFATSAPPASWSGGHVGVRGGSFVLRDTTFAGATTLYGGAVYLESTVATLASSTFTGGYAAGYGAAFGGAIYAWDSDVEIVDATFEGNASGYVGGAVYGAYSRLTVTGGSFVRNTAAWWGGALFCDVGADCVVDGVLVDGNTAWQGGAVMVFPGATATLLRSTFVGNSASSGGAVFLSDAGPLVAANDVFCGNSAPADAGGAIYVWSSEPATLRNNHFVENSALYWGAALAVFDGVATSTNDLFAGNGAADLTGGPWGYYQGAAIELYWPAYYPASAVDVRHGLFYANAADANVPLDPTVRADDPQLAAWVPGDCRTSDLTPLLGSPLVDGGDPALLDPDGSRSDIGAYGGPDADPAFWADDDGDGTPAGWDCAPDDGDVGPGLPEICDGLDLDDDCDGFADEADPDLVAGCPDPPAARDPSPRDVGETGCGCGTGTAGGLAWIWILAATARRRSGRSCRRAR